MKTHVVGPTLIPSRPRIVRATLQKLYGANSIPNPPRCGRRVFTTTAITDRRVFFNILARRHRVCKIHKHFANTHGGKPNCHVLQIVMEFSIAKRDFAKAKI